MVEKRAQEFIRIVSSQLVEDQVFSTQGSEVQLKEVLEECIAELPEGELKEELGSNRRDVYFQKFQNVLKTHLRKSGRSRSVRGTKRPPPERELGCGLVEQRQPSKVPSQVKREKEKVEGWSVNMLTASGVEKVLTKAKELKDGKEKHQLYCNLVMASHKDQSLLSTVLKQWSEDMNTLEPSTCLDAIRVCSITLASHHRGFIPWLQFCFRIFSQLVDRTLAVGGASQTDHTQYVDNTARIRLSLFGVLTHSHMIHRHRQCSEDPVYSDTVAALLSLYIDLMTVSEPDSSSPSEQLLSMVTTLLGHSPEHCLDVVLQSACEPSAASATLLLPLLRKLLTLQTNCDQPSHFIKCLCGFLKASAMEQAGTQAVGQHDKLTFKVPTPVNFLEWLWKRNRGACSELGLRQKWTQEKTVRYLLMSLSGEQMEQLLDLATDGMADEHAQGDGVERAEEEGYRGGETASLYFLDTQRGNSPQGEDNTDDAQNVAGASQLSLEAGEESLQEEIMEGTEEGVPEESSDTDDNLWNKEPTSLESTFCTPNSSKLKGFPAAGGNSTAEQSSKDEWQSPGDVIYPCVSKCGDREADRLEPPPPHGSDYQPQNSSLDSNTPRSKPQKWPPKDGAASVFQEEAPNMPKKVKLHVGKVISPLELRSRSVARRKRTTAVKSPLTTPKNATQAERRPATAVKSNKSRCTLSYLGEDLTMSAPSKRHSRWMRGQHT